MTLASLLRTSAECCASVKSGERVRRNEFKCWAHRVPLAGPGRYGDLSILPFAAREPRLDLLQQPFVPVGVREGGV